jgi:hypothetical protein
MWKNCNKCPLKQEYDETNSKNEISSIVEKDYVIFPLFIVPLANLRVYRSNVPIVIGLDWDRRIAEGMNALACQFWVTLGKNVGLGADSPNYSPLKFTHCSHMCINF